MQRTLQQNNIMTTLGFLVVLLQCKSQLIIKLLPSLLAAQLGSNTSTALPLPPSSSFQICHQLGVWDFMSPLHVHLAPQEHRQICSNGISLFLGSGKSKSFTDHRLFSFDFGRVCPPADYLEYSDNSTTVTKKAWCSATARVKTR